jgi:hypothetical protein
VSLSILAHFLESGPVHTPEPSILAARYGANPTRIVATGGPSARRARHRLGSSRCVCEGLSDCVRVRRGQVCGDCNGEGGWESPLDLAVLADDGFHVTTEVWRLRLLNYDAPLLILAGTQYGWDR